MGSIPGSERSPGGAHGNPFQYACLENSMDTGAWRATVHRVAKSQTWLKQLSRHTNGTGESSREQGPGKRPLASVSCCLSCPSVRPSDSIPLALQAAWSSDTLRAFTPSLAITWGKRKKIKLGMLIIPLFTKLKFYASEYEELILL